MHTHPTLSYPAAVILQKVHLDSLQAAIVTTCVDLKHKTQHQNWSSCLRFKQSLTEWSESALRAHHVLVDGHAHDHVTVATVDLQLPV